MERLQSVRELLSARRMTTERFDSIGRIIRSRPYDEKVFAKEWQKEILLGYFEKDPYPPREVLQELEKKVELDFHWLRNWYQYQRKRRNIRQEKYFKSLKREQFILDGEPELADFEDSPVDDVQPATPELPTSSTKKIVKSKEWQRDILLEYFGRTAYPTTEDLAQMETKTKLDAAWIKSWFHTKRKREKKNRESNSENLLLSSTGEKGTLSEDALPDETIEKEKEAEGSTDQTAMYKKLKKNFEELQSRYNVLAELLLQRSILTTQNDNVDTKVPTVDLTETSSEAGGQMNHYPPVSYPPPPPHPPQSYPYPHYYPPYYPPQYPPYYPHPHPAARPPGGPLPYPAMPQ